MAEAEEIIKALNLRPHPEGGHFIESWRHDTPDGVRGAGTAIYFLLRAGERSHWHRIDATEIWHHYAGAALKLQIASDAGRETAILGPNVLAHERPQAAVPPGAWQAAESLGSYSLVGCTVSPAFLFENFELAEPGWEPS